VTKRAEVVRMVRENQTDIAANLNDFWRRWVQDLIAGGVPAADVVETMVSVAGAQVMRTRGATYAAQSFRQMAEAFQIAADAGCEYPATEH